MGVDDDFMAELSGVQNNYRRPIVNAGKVMHVYAHGRGDAGDMVRYIRGERFILHSSLTTQVYPSMFYICTCATYPYRP